MATRLPWLRLSPTESGPGCSEAEAIAGARLIPAAPDLLAACKALLDAPHHEHLSVRLNDEEMAALDSIKNAIAKAEGAAQGR